MTSIDDNMHNNTSTGPTYCATIEEDGTNFQKRCLLIALWNDATHWLRTIMKRAVVACALHASRHPLWYILGLPFLSLLLVAIGILTNFRLELDIEAILSPTGSQPAYHKDWVYSPAGFPNAAREVALLLHRQGDNVLTMEAMERMLVGVDTIRETDGFEELCSQGNYVDFEGRTTCRVTSATAYFDHDLEVFRDQIHSDLELRQAMSSPTFANGSPVYTDSVLGNWEKDTTSGNLTFAQSFLVIFFLPDTDDADSFEEKMFPRLDKLRRQWMKADKDSNTNVVDMDMISIYGTQMEYQRAIYEDIYLGPLVAILMGSFVGLAFASFGFGGHTHANSRILLGVASLFTILMSYLAGNGVMFICGVPFTPVTQILPFVVFGVGLDDTFIIVGAYLRTDPNLDILDRMQSTMEEVAHSITLTTITTVFAFLLGLMSSLQGVQWLCLYAFTAVAIDFFYQITLFCAFIVMDERRIQAGRRDICIWLPERRTSDRKAEMEDDNQIMDDQSLHSTKSDSDSDAIVNNNAEESYQQATTNELSDCNKSVPERIMSCYADFLLRPRIKALVIVLFVALTCCCAYSTTLLTQEFKIGDFVPNDSYLKNMLYSLQNYASVVRPIAVYFRDIDQTDPAMQEQMVNYVNTLESLPQLGSSANDTAVADLAGVDDSLSSEVKPFCWVRDFQQIRDRPELAFAQNLTFSQQLDLAMANPTVREVYGQDIVRDQTGNITASRCWLFLTDIDLDSVEEQIDLLHAQREIGEVQAVNQGKPKGGWPFFVYDDALFYWEAYDIAIQELVFTIISGVVAITVIAFVLIPHWTAVCFVTPMIAMLYTNFLGTLQFFGLHINSIFYFCVLVSIGLLVDFLLHVLMRYYETSPEKTRDERVKETLETMGASIMLGGLTTFLGVVPLCISSTEIFMIVFVSFIAMVVLGLAHGLVLLPVILSLVGPNTGIVSQQDDEAPRKEGNEAPTIVDPTSTQENTSTENSTIPSIGVDSASSNMEAAI